jgi:hypothetical protein
MTTITQLPDPPSTADPANFAAEADAFIAALPEFVDEINEFGATLNNLSTTSTSTSSVLIGTGTKNFTVETGKSYFVGMSLKLAFDATNWMVGEVISYDTGTGALSVNVIETRGTGTYALWTITLSFNSNLGKGHNVIIGGDFTTNPWQRGTSFPALASGSYSADRWVPTSINAAVFSVLKTADAPTAAQAGIFTQHCLHIDITTADASLAATDRLEMGQIIEGLNSASFGFGQAGSRFVTVSFWHKHTKSGIHCVSLANGAGDRSYVAEYTQDVSDTWERAELTIPVDTTGTWLYDTGAGLRLRFSLAAGTNFQTAAGVWASGNFTATSSQVNNLDSTANNFKIALVQLEAGSTATAFETRSVGQELDLCQRYYYRNTPSATGNRMGNGYVAGTTTAQVLTEFKVPMRTPPTSLEQSGTATDYSVAYAATNAACSAVPTFSTATVDQALVIYTTAAVLTVGQGCQVRANNGSVGFIGFTAEL